MQITKTRSELPQLSQDKRNDVGLYKGISANFSRWLIYAPQLGRARGSYQTLVEEMKK